jgi:Asp-tRNA(Asn)/Glu-tRNA(Gln) amidotransferase C subunit
MDEKKEEAIKKEAKEILKKFSKAIEKVKIKKKDLKGKAGGFREESAGAEGDEDFRKRMFENAPEKDDDCIMAEKKQW